jgi:hypothetical protein
LKRRRISRAKNRNRDVMDFWSRLYEAPQVLTADWGHHRIYAPIAYPVVRSCGLVPIVHTEVLELAQLFPVCWAMSPSGPELCVLRTLLSGGRAMPSARMLVSALPRVFHAYPVIVPHDDGLAAGPISVDAAIADEPTDVGAPLMTAGGRPTKAVSQRIRTASETGRTLQTTRALSRALHEAGLLEPWPLEFGLGDDAADLGRLMVVSRARLGDPSVYKIILSFGSDAALFLSAHWTSLFRVSALLSAAKATLAVRAQETEAA